MGAAVDTTNNSLLREGDSLDLFEKLKQQYNALPRTERAGVYRDNTRPP